MNHLARAVAKCKYYPNLCHQWGGYLTAVEIVALVDAGAKVTGNGWDVTRARENVVAGKANPTWFYFVPNKALDALLAEKKDNKKVGTRAKV